MKNPAIYEADVDIGVIAAFAANETIITARHIIASINGHWIMPCNLNRGYLIKRKPITKMPNADNDVILLFFSVVFFIFKPPIIPSSTGNPDIRCRPNDRYHHSLVFLFAPPVQSYASANSQNADIGAADPIIDVHMLLNTPFA